MTSSNKLLESLNATKLATINALREAVNEREPLFSAEKVTALSAALKALNEVSDLNRVF